MDEERMKLLVQIADGSFVELKTRSLYASVEEAAKIAGVSYGTMSEWANSKRDPIPHIDVGRAKKLIRVSAIPQYARGKEAV